MSVIHVVTWLILFWSLQRTMQPASSAVVLCMAVLAFGTFHRRLHETYVRKRWKAARLCARLWHILGFVTMLALVIGSS